VSFRGGLLLLDKPTGPTSHDLVARVRRALGIRRVGHAGTLDPLASGLLPVVIGAATRLVGYLPSSPKTYTGTLLLGRRTATDDVTGKTLEQHTGAWPSPGTVERAARSLTGRYDQQPPVVSARKIGGERLYRLARRGTPVAAPARSVEVGRFDLEATGRPELYRFVAVVSAGTYIRALARDLGQALGCGGTLASLRRTTIGPLAVAEAVEAPGEGDGERERLLRALRPLEEMPLRIPTVVLAAAEQASLFVAGGTPPLPFSAPPGPLRVVDGQGRVLGIGEPREDRLQPRVVLPRSE